MRSITDYGIREYYSKADSAISPVTVTGVGIYIFDETDIIQFDTFGNAGISNHIFAFLPPSCFAESAEDVRYLINITNESYQYYGTYNDSTKGYSATALVSLKDTDTGSVLFSEYYTVTPPDSMSVFGNNSSDTYATVGFGYIHEKLILDIKPILETLLPVLATDSFLMKD
jgi:hypothetical protein